MKNTFHWAQEYFSEELVQLDIPKAGGHQRYFALFQWSRSSFSVASSSAYPHFWNFLLLCSADLVSWLSVLCCNSGLKMCCMPLFTVEQDGQWEEAEKTHMCLVIVLYGERLRRMEGSVPLQFTRMVTSLASLCFLLTLARMWMLEKEAGPEESTALSQLCSTLAWPVHLSLYWAMTNLESNSWFF